MTSRGQEIVDYNHVFDTETTEAEKQAGELVLKWEAHLYLKEALLTPQQRSQVLASAFGAFNGRRPQEGSIDILSVSQIDSPQKRR